MTQQYDYFAEIQKILKSDDKKDWKDKDIAWYFSRAVKNINEFEKAIFKDKKNKIAMKAIEEAGAFMFIVANLAKQHKKGKIPIDVD